MLAAAAYSYSPLAFDLKRSAGKDKRAALWVFCWHGSRCAAAGDEHEETKLFADKQLVVKLHS